MRRHGMIAPCRWIVARVAQRADCRQPSGRELMKTRKPLGSYAVCAAKGVIMNQNLWERSRAIMSVLRGEIDRRANGAATDRAEIARAVLDELTPPGWRYQLYPPTGAEGPDFMLIPAAFT